MPQLADTYTANYGFVKAAFNVTTWHDKVNGNFDRLDTVISASGRAPIIDGDWAVSTLYTVGDRIYDGDLPNIYECLVTHTSPATGTFLAARVAQPTYWALVHTGITWRENWVTLTVYRIGDLVYNTNVYIATVDHTSGVFATDLAAGKWDIFVEKGASGSGLGDVTGPAAANNNAVAQFDGVTGKLIKDSTVPLAALATLASPTFTGIPAAPTAGAGTNTTQLATTAYVRAEVNALIGGAPGALDTLDELAAALGDDASLAATMAASLALKAPLASPALSGVPTGPTAAPGTNSIQLASTAFVTAAIAAYHPSYGQHTIWVPAGTMTSRTTAGAPGGSTELATNKQMLVTKDFDSTVAEHVQFGIQMPKSWDEGDIVAQFIWTHAATTVNFDVRWGLEAISYADTEAGDAVFGTVQEVTDTGGVTDAVYITSETAALNASGAPSNENLLLFHVYRDPTHAADNMAIDARLLGVKIHYTTNADTDS